MTKLVRYNETKDKIYNTYRYYIYKYCADYVDKVTRRKDYNTVFVTLSNSKNLITFLKINDIINDKINYNYGKRYTNNSHCTIRGNVIAYKVAQKGKKLLKNIENFEK